MKYYFLAAYFLFTSVCSAEKNELPIQTSAMIVDLTHPRVLYADHPDLPLTPASTSKLFVAATALRQLGNNYHFTTSLYTQGSLVNGVLRGDLMLYGVGDPALTNEKLWALTNQLQQVGLKKIEGNLIINTHYLGDVIANDPDRIQAKTFTDNAYSGLPSSAGSNFGTIGVSVFPSARVNTFSRNVIVPFPLSNVSLSGKVITANDKKNPLTLLRATQNNIEMLILSGAIKKDAAPLTLYRSVSNPDLLTGNLLKGFLNEAGIALTGQVHVENKMLDSKNQVLTSIDSDSLPILLQSMLHNSNN